MLDCMWTSLIDYLGHRTCLFKYLRRWLRYSSERKQKSEFTIPAQHIDMLRSHRLDAIMESKVTGKTLQVLFAPSSSKQKTVALQKFRKVRKPSPDFLVVPQIKMPTQQQSMTWTQVTVLRAPAGDACAHHDPRCATITWFRFSKWGLMTWMSKLHVDQSCGYESSWVNICELRVCVV